MNPGIVKTVEWLQSLGFKTTDSGDGETHDYECDRLYPYVVMACHPNVLIDNCKYLQSQLSTKNIQIYPVGGDRPCIQGSFDPADQTAVIELMNVKDKDLVK